MKKGCVLILGIIFLSMQAFSQEGLPKLYADFQYAEVSGKVVNKKGNGVPGIKIRVFLLEDGKGVFGNVNAIETGHYTTNFLEMKSWTITESDGSYMVKGLPYPSSYIMEIKGVEGYKNTQKLLRIDTGRGDKITNFNFILDTSVFNSVISGKIDDMYYLYQQKKYDDAKSAAESLLEKNPDVGDAYVILGNVSLKNQKGEEALGYFKKAMDSGNNSESLVFSVAKLNFQLGKFQESVAMCEQLLKKSPDNTDYLYTAGMALFNMRDYKKAAKYLSAFNSAVDDNSKDRYFYYAYGLSSFYSGSYSEAVNFLENAEKKGMTDNVELYKALVGSCLKVSQNKKALEYINKTLTAFPEFKGREAFLKMKSQMK